MNKTCKNNFFENIKILSGAQLKSIAFISMLIDQLFSIQFWQKREFRSKLVTFLKFLNELRFHFFHFFLLKVFFKTRNRWKYLSHLLIFGITSEILYDLFQSVVLFELNSNNVMFTLALSLVTIWIIDVLKKKRKNKYIWYFILFIIVVALCVVAMVLGLDYEKHEILIGYFFYIFYPAHLWLISLIAFLVK